MSRNNNDIEVSNIETNNVNDNDAKGMSKILNVERIARDLVVLFGSQNISNPKDDRSWEFYCRAANKLSESEIRRNIEVAQRRAKTNPGGYFNVLCRASIYKLKSVK